WGALCVSVEILDLQRVRFRMKQPWPDFMTFYATPATSAAWIVPKKYVERVGDDGFKKAPVGAGPYRFVPFNPGVELVVEAYDGYWRKTPSVKRVVLRSVPDESTRTVVVKRGGTDSAYGLRGRPAEAAYPKGFDAVEVATDARVRAGGRGRAERAPGDRHTRAATPDGARELLQGRPGKAVQVPRARWQWRRRQRGDADRGLRDLRR